MMTEAEILVQIEGLSSERLSIFVAQSWVRPRLTQTGRVFDEIDIARLRLIVELTEDLAVNDEAVPLILNLIDEVSTLRHHMRALDAALGAEDRAVCEAVVTRLQAMRRGSAA